MPSAHTPQSGSLAGAWRKFWSWRRGRPFSGGLLLILSGVELFFSSNLDLGAIQVHVGPTGFLSYVIPAMILLCGGGALMTPQLRLFYGVVGSLVAVYSLIGLNFGGFLLGLLLGIIGGALTIAWSPVAAATPTTDGPAGGDVEDTEDAAGVEDTEDAAGPEATEDAAVTPADHPHVPGPAGEQHPGPQPEHGTAQLYRSASALDETMEIPRHVQNPERWWGPTEEAGQPVREEEPPPFGTNSGGNHTRMLAITLVPVTLAAALVAVVHRATPAYAAPCPTSSASASVAAKASGKPARSGAQATKPGAQGNKPAGTASAPAVPQSGATAGAAEPNPSASPAAAPSSEPTQSGNLLTSLWNGLVDGVEKLFGAGDSTAPADPAPAPSASASPGPSAAPSAGGASPGASAQPSASAAPNRPHAAASTSTSACQLTMAATDPGQPPAALAPGLITGSKQVMQDFEYEGIVDLPTANGTKKALKFTMTSAVTTPFSLKVAEKSGKSTEITSTELTIRSQQNTVTFYTSRFTGTLSHVTLPVIPIPIGVPDFLKPLTTLTFTPDSPPSLLTGITIPEITFENVTLELAFVHSDILTAQAMHIQPV